MLRVVQHVISPTSRKHGFNAYRYKHAALRPWPDRPQDVIDDLDVELVESDIDVPPGGNRVLSYIDVLTPNTLEVTELLDVFDHLKARARRPRSGMVDAMGLGFRFYVVPGLRKRWRAELDALVDALLVLG